MLLLTIYYFFKEYVLKFFLKENKTDTNFFIYLRKSNVDQQKKDPCVTNLELREPLPHICVYSNEEILSRLDLGICFLNNPIKTKLKINSKKSIKIPTI